MARPLPKTNAPALANSQKMFASEGTSGAAAAGTASAKTPGSPATLERSRVRRERQPARPAVSAGQAEEPYDLALRPRRGQRHHGGDRPEQRISREGEARQLVRGSDDDANHRSADAVEQRLHPRQAAEADVGHRDGPHHEKRRQDEADRDHRGAQHASADVAEYRELRGQRAGASCARARPSR